MNKRLEKLKSIAILIGKSVKLSLAVSKRSTIAMFAIIVFVSLIPFVISWIDNKIIDALIDSSKGTFTQSLLIFFSLGVIFRIFLQLFWSLSSYFEKLNYFAINKYMNLEVSKKLSGLDILYYEDPELNDLVQNVREQYTWRPSDFMLEIFWIFRDVVGIVASAVIIFSFSPIIFLVIFIMTIPIFISELKFGRGGWTLWNANLTDRRVYGDLSWMVAEENSLFDFKVYRSRHYLLDVLKNLFNRFQDKEKKHWMKRNLIGAILSVISVLGVVVGELYVIASVVAGKITVGQFSFYSRTFLSFSDSIGSFFHRFARIYEHSLYVGDIFKFLDMEPIIKDGNAVLKLDKPPIIEFKHVYFKYPKSEEYLFKDLNLTINSGESIAIVGENGAGKSTLIKLLTRFYIPDKGEILINGVNLNELKIDSWYKYLSALFQSFTVYGPFDLKTNIGLGRISKMNDKKRLEEATKLADAESLVAKLEKGYDTIISKRYKDGVDLSGGEMQKVALARAFFRNAPVLILDEPTSAIDAKAEKKIFTNLFDFAKAKTTIIISHRFSTVRNADRILAMENGKIIENGTHEELMKEDGLYAKMFTIQAESYQ